MQNERPRLKKWVIQTIICAIIFSVLYASSKIENNISMQINNFRQYAMVHNTDFEWIYNNTVNMMSTVVDMMFTEDTESVFNNSVHEETETEPAADNSEE